jgi:hypothetical protein
MHDDGRVEARTRLIRPMARETITAGSRSQIGSSRPVMM